MSVLDDLIVGYGPEQLHDIEVHDREDGSAVIEEVTSRPVRVFEKQPDGSLKELHGETKNLALEAFWASVDEFNEINSNGGNH
ncbi:hypothetical protein [Streptomyces spiralis]